MTREELEHIIRASGDITDQYEFVIVGSQSILGAVSRPEDVFTVSMEAGIYPLQAPELVKLDELEALRLEKVHQEFEQRHDRGMEL